MKKFRTFAFYIAVVGLVVGILTMFFASEYVEHGEPKGDSPFKVLQMISAIALFTFFIGTVVLWLYAFMGSFNHQKTDTSRLVKVILGNVFSGYIYYFIDKQYPRLTSDTKPND